MHPNLYLHEKFLAQRSQELDRAVAYSYLLVGQPRQRVVMLRHLVAQLGLLLVALGSRLQQLEQHRSDEHVAYPR